MLPAITTMDSWQLKKPIPFSMKINQWFAVLQKYVTSILFERKKLYALELWGGGRSIGAGCHQVQSRLLSPEVRFRLLRKQRRLRLLHHSWNLEEELEMRVFMVILFWQLLLNLKLAQRFTTLEMFRRMPSFWSWVKARNFKETYLHNRLQYSPGGCSRGTVLGYSSKRPGF